MSGEPGNTHLHHNLVVWQKAMDLVDRIYDLAAKFPPEEAYGLRSQLTRAAVSVPANIAEGQARTTPKDFANFLTIAKSSLMETDTLVRVALRRKYVREDVASDALLSIVEVSKMIVALRNKVRPERKG